MAMAHELYDHMMHQNDWFDFWIKTHPGMDRAQLEEAFVDKNLPVLLPQARATLAGMLTTVTDPKLRDEIYDALVLDNTLLRGRIQ